MLQVLGQPHVVLSIAVLVGNGPALQYQGEGVGLLPDGEHLLWWRLRHKKLPCLAGFKTSDRLPMGCTWSCSGRRGFRLTRGPCAHELTVREPTRPVTRFRTHGQCHFSDPRQGLTVAALPCPLTRSSAFVLAQEGCRLAIRAASPHPKLIRSSSTLVRG